METSQQQRRPTVGQFAKTLAKADLVFDAIDLADILWLAQFIEPGAVAVVEATPAGSAEKKPERPPAVESSNVANEEPAIALYPEDPVSAPTQVETAQTEAPPEKPKGTPFSVPAAPALRTRMDLARALRPLMRRVPSRTRFDLDEDATVTQIAETEVWMPVVRPTPERWLELDLVVESSKTTVIWERAIAELNHLAEYQGAFRAVRTWRLAATGDHLQLFPRWRNGSANSTATPDQVSNARPHTPKELVDPSGRRLIWLVTDCTSALWRQELIYETLQQWTAEQPTAIVQLFPDSLWKRTALRNGHQVKLSALAPGLPSARLEVEGLPRRLECRSRADLVTIPVVMLDAIALRQWANVIVGAGDSRTPGRTFDLAFIARQALIANPGPSSQSANQRTAQERVDLFRATTASETVKHLANLMAATPVSLPVIDLLRDAFRADFAEEVRQSHVAEVLLSGLLRRCDTEDEEICRYEFFGDGSSDSTERVRDILLGDASVSKTIEVLNVLSASICQKMKSPVKSFQALLAELNNSDKDELREAALPFARVGVDVLRRLGGEHAAIANRYDPERPGDTISHEVEWPNFPLQDFEYEVAEYLNFPLLEPFDFIDAQFTDTAFPPPLQPDDFTIVTVELEPLTEPSQELESVEFPHERPTALRMNAGKSFIGINTMGMGFIFDDSSSKATSIAEMNRLIAKEPRNAELIFPYISGREVNTDPIHAHHCYVINFGEMEELEARQWPDLMAIVEEKVKPERLVHWETSRKRERFARYWWRFGTTISEFSNAIAECDCVLVIPRISKYAAFTVLPTGMVYSQSLVVFSLETKSAFCILQSRLHEVWARFYGSELNGQLRYTPSHCFETFPFPENWETDFSLESVGKNYYEFRADLMVRNNQGLTATYNRFHDFDETEPDILELRELHAQMDRAVLDAYGWTDISTDCEFRSGYEKANIGVRKLINSMRYSWPEEVHDEVLARLLALNKQRAEEEE